MTVEFFAELGSNHNHDLDRAFNLIYRANKIGCTGVKFQYFRADSLWNKDKFPAEYASAKYNELNPEWLPAISEAVRAKGMLFGMSVFDPNDVEFLEPYVDYFKIASFEAGWFDLIKAVYATEKRLMISTGQASKSELNDIFLHLPIHLSTEVDFLHCVSKYPAKLKDCNFNIIKENSVINGWSDHTVFPTAIYTAIALGARVIEFHLDLNDKQGKEWHHSWTPSKMGQVIAMSKILPEALGDGNWDNFYNAQDLKYKCNSATGMRGE